MCPQNTAPLFDQIQLIADEEDYLVINKPAGISFHLEKNLDSKLALANSGVVGYCERHFGYAKLYPVHRLDKMTSGLLILAKNPASAARFGELFANHQLDKYYIALADKKPKKKQGWIKGDMQSARRGSFKLLTTMQNPAITRFLSQSITPGTRLYLLKPFTGKTHQLRVAMKSLGVPINGDQRYQNLEQASLFDRGYLHAYAIRFDWASQTKVYVCLPIQGKKFADLSVQMQLEAWNRPWDVL